MVSLAPLAKTQVHKVLCSFQDFYSNKRLVDSQKTKIIAQFTEKHTHTWSESGKIPLFSHVQSIKFPVVKGKKIVYDSLAKLLIQISRKVHKFVLGACENVHMFYLSLYL